MRNIVRPRGLELSEFFICTRVHVGFSCMSMSFRSILDHLHQKELTLFRERERERAREGRREGDGK